MRDWGEIIRKRLAAARLDGAAEADVVEELSQHLDDRYADLRARGETEADAMAAVLAELDEDAGLLARGVSQTKRGARPALVIGAGGGGMLGGFRGDVAYAVRSMRRSPGYAALVVLTLALGIGAASTMQAVIDPLLLRPLTFAQPDRLVTLSEGLLPGEYEIIRTETNAFERTALVHPGQAYGISGDGEPERVSGAAVTPEFFATLGVAPLVGNTTAEMGPGDAAAVLSHSLWQRRFGGDRDVIGRAVRVDGRPVTVVAVMPSHFRHPGRTELWLVAPLRSNEVAALWGVGGYRLLGRLRTAESAGTAEAAIRALSPTMSEANPLWTPAADYRAGTRVVALHEAMVGNVREPLLLLGGAVALLLLIACANVGNLVLARGLGRARELAVRTSLGASGVRIVRQILTETVVLAGAGGLAGVVLAFVAVAALRNALPADLPRLAEIGVDPRVLAASVGVTLLTGLLLGVLPALRATRFDLQSTLRDGARTAGERGGRRLSGGLVVLQVALAVMLVTGAGLLARSLIALQETDTGIGRPEVVTARVDLPSAQYGEAARRGAFYDELLARVAALPGVSTVAATSQLPFSGHLQLTAMSVEHVTTDPNNLPVFVHRRVTRDFFDAAGIALRRGRLFTAADLAPDGPPVAIIDEAAARTFWPGEDPIGRRLGRPWLNEMMVVVGVVGAVLDGELAGQAEQTVYTPLPKEPPTSAFIVVQTSMGPGTVPALREALRATDATVPLSDIGTISALVSGTLAARRLSAALLSAFGLLALVLAAVGIHGVLAYAIGQRVRELSLRLALGARPDDLMRMVLAQGLRLAGTGAAIGLAAALVLSRFVRGMLHGIAPHDPATFAAVIIIVLVVAAAAVLVPALRASRVAPMAVLRE